MEVGLSARTRSLSIETCKSSAHSLSTVALFRAISSCSAPVARMTRAVSASVASFLAASTVLRVPMSSSRSRRKSFLQSNSALCTSRGSVRRRTPSRDTKSSSRPSSTARLQTRRCQDSQRGVERAYLPQIPCSLCSSEDPRARIPSSSASSSFSCSSRNAKNSAFSFDSRSFPDARCLSLYAQNHDRLFEGTSERNSCSGDRPFRPKRRCPSRVLSPPPSELAPTRRVRF